MRKFVEMQFNADLKNVVFSRGVVASFFLDEEYDLDLINEVKTIVSEAVTNAILHGYQSDASKLVKLILELEENTLKITVSDRGVGIEDVSKAREPLFTSSFETERAGIGFTVMQVFSDIFDIESEVGVGTTIYATKNLN